MYNNCGSCGSTTTHLEAPRGRDCKVAVCPPLTMDDEGCIKHVGIDEEALARGMCREMQVECGMLVALYTPSGKPGQGGALTPELPVTITPTPGGGGLTVGINPAALAPKLCAPMKETCGMLITSPGAGGAVTGVSPIQVGPSANGNPEVSLLPIAAAAALCAPLKSECGMLTAPAGYAGGPVTSTGPVTVTPSAGGGVQVGWQGDGLAAALCEVLKSACGMLFVSGATGGPVRGISPVVARPVTGGGTELDIDVDALAAALCEPLTTKCGFAGTA